MTSDLRVWEKTLSTLNIYVVFPIVKEQEELCQTRADIDFETEKGYNRGIKHFQLKLNENFTFYKIVSLLSFYGA